MTVLEPEIEALVAEVAAAGAAASVAFDADGTIWAGDIGEDFLRDLAAHGRLLEAPEEPYAIYERLFATDPPRAFAFCVEVMKGLAVADLERWSDELFQSRFRRQVFPGIQQVVERLDRAGLPVFLVSASNAITVRRAALAMGLAPANVLAVEGAVDGRGRLTGEVLPPITCGPGKVEALEARLAGRLSLAFGNSLFDREMLERAERAVMVAPQGSEGPAVALARARGWPVHRVRG